MKFNFNIPEEKWNLVSKVGYPEDGEWCFLIYKGRTDYCYSVGGYDERKSNFYVNFGLGGAVLDEADVIAWALFEEDYLKTFSKE